MSIFKIATAGALLFILAPDETRTAVKSMLGFAQEAKELLPAAAAEQAMGYCKANPEKCMEMAKQASNAAEAVKPKR